MSGPDHAPDITGKASELEQWSRAISVRPAALARVGQGTRRARDVPRAISSVVFAATSRARGLEATDPVRALMILGMVETMRAAIDPTLEQLEAGTVITPEAYNGIWQAMLGVTSGMGDPLPVNELARNSVQQPIPDGAPSRLDRPTGPRGARRAVAPAPPSSPSSGAGAGLAVLAGAGIVAFGMSRRRGRGRA